MENKEENDYDIRQSITSKKDIQVLELETFNCVVFDCGCISVCGTYWLNWTAVSFFTNKKCSDLECLSVVLA